MTKRLVKSRLLLDEMFPRREKFPNLNNLHTVRHVIHDLKMAGAKDADVVKLASKNNMIIITKNVKDYINLAAKEKVDMFFASETIPPEILDKLILSKLNKRKASKMTGITIKITQPARKR